MNISHDYAETIVCISDGDIDKKTSHILNMINKNKNKKNDKDVVVSFNQNTALYNNYYHGDALYGSPSKRIKKRGCTIIDNIHEVYNRSDKVRNFILSDNNANPKLSKGYNLVTTDKPARVIFDKRVGDVFMDDSIRNDNILSVQREIMKYNAEMARPQETINITSYEETCDYGKVNIISTEMPTEVIQVGSPIPSEFPVFMNHAAESKETKNPLPNIVLNQRGNGEQDKMLFFSTDTVKYPASQENNRADYYFSYYFRQKYQSPEPVYIYRDQSNRFKLDAHSELVKRKLKLAMDVNMIDDIDIL